MDDAGHQRRILVEHEGGQSSVVWNPGSETVKGFGDIPDAAWQDFACVEIGNVLDNTIVIPANEKHTLTQLLSL
jgi:glucose-6-phosphate 1-epimerase